MEESEPWSKAFPQEAVTSLQIAKCSQEEGRMLEAIRHYQKGLICLLKAKNDPLCTPALASEIKSMSQPFIQSLNTCIQQTQASLLDISPKDEFPCGEHCNQIFKDEKQRRYHLNRVSSSSQNEPPSKKPFAEFKKSFKIKNPLCSLEHDHIYLSETFQTMEDANQFMIDSGLRTLYRVRSSNPVGAHYVCKHGAKGYECKKKVLKETSCNLSIKISTKLISRSEGERVFSVRGCLNHNHELHDVRLSPSILKFMKRSGEEGVYLEGHPELEVDNQVIVEYEESDGEVERTEIYFPLLEEPSREEVTKDKSSILVNQIHPCNGCSKVFFDQSSFSEHSCYSLEDVVCAEKSHVHQFLDQSFDSMEEASEYVRSLGLQVYFCEQFRRKDFIVYQCSKGVHPNQASLRNSECPATFTIKASHSRFAVQGCIAHNHETHPQFLQYLRKRGEAAPTGPTSSEDFKEKKDYATNLLIGTISYLKNLSHSENDTLDAIIKATSNALSPRINQATTKDT